jgi:hypothetical protein
MENGTTLKIPPDTITLTVELPFKMYSDFDIICQRLGTTVADAVTRLISDWVDDRRILISTKQTTVTEFCQRAD